MGSLPSNTFLFNYNALQYDAVTRTFPKTHGQLFDEDLVLDANPAGFVEGSDSVDFGSSGAKMYKEYPSEQDNPFNRTGTDTLTFIYKAFNWATEFENIFANRGNGYNYMVRGLYFHTNIGGVLQEVLNFAPHICVIRVFPDGSGEMKQINPNDGQTITTTTSNISWGSQSNIITFFASSYGNTSNFYEPFTNKFYWMYCSNECLTDEEIQEVIEYNNSPSSNVFKINKKSIEFKYSGGTDTVTLQSTKPWTASTLNWISLSQTTGETDATITVTTGQNTGGVRTGAITFTNGEDTLTCTITQGMNNTFPIKKIYRNGRRIN